MPDLTVRDATKAELGEIAPWLIEEAEKDPFFRKTIGAGWRRWLYERYFVPRYLRRTVYSWALVQDGQLAGYALIEPRGVAMQVAEVAVRAGFDRNGLVTVALRRVDAFAREREYHYVRISPVSPSEADLVPHLAAGYEKLDYYLYAYTGQTAGGDVPREVTMRPLSGRTAIERRVFYLRQELDASQVAGRDLVEAGLLPSRPPTHRAYEIEYQGGDIGYFAPRPNERGDGVLTFVLSLEPQYWGSDLEMRLVAGLARAAGQAEAMPMRLLLSTTAHCEKADAGLVALGLQRVLDIRPVLFKRIDAGSA